MLGTLQMSQEEEGKFPGEKLERKRTWGVSKTREEVVAGVG